MEQELSQRIRASEIVTLIYECYLRRPKMRGNRDENFFERINAVFVWIAGFIHAHLNSYVIWYVLYLSCAKATANTTSLHYIQCTLAIAELINRCKRFTITIALISL